MLYGQLLTAQPGPLFALILMWSLIRTRPEGNVHASRVILGHVSQNVDRIICNVFDLLTVAAVRHSYQTIMIGSRPIEQGHSSTLLKFHLIAYAALQLRFEKCNLIGVPMSVSLICCAWSTRLFLQPPDAADICLASCRFFIHSESIIFRLVQRGHRRSVALGHRAEHTLAGRDSSVRGSRGLGH